MLILFGCRPQSTCRQGHGGEEKEGENFFFSLKFQFKRSLVGMPIIVVQYYQSIWVEGGHCTHKIHQKAKGEVETK